MKRRFFLRIDNRFLLIFIYIETSLKVMPFTCTFNQNEKSEKASRQHASY